MAVLTDAPDSSSTDTAHWRSGNAYTTVARIGSIVAMSVDVSV